MNSRAAPGQYTAVAAALHWLVALLVIANAAGGWLAGWFGTSTDPALKVTGGAIIAVHRSVGLTILALTVVRLGWRLANPPPPLPTYMTAFERRTALGVHLSFYGLLFMLPLSGWVLASSGRSPVQLSWFGLFNLPAMPFAARLHVLSRESHELLGWGMIILVLVHVGAALKHQILDRDNILARMLPRR